MLSWYKDLFSIPNGLREHLCVLGGLKLSTWMNKVMAVSQIFGLEFPNQFSVRKLSYFSDKEGKTRTIGILDYISQSVLKNLHQYIEKCLKKIPQDLTFDQSKFKEMTKDWPIYYSVDLSNATDRFPVSLISQLLCAHLPTSYVKSWEQVMIGLPFKLKEKGRRDQWVSYSTGQPMGAYSSFVTFALTHHYCLYYLCRINNIDWKTSRYCLLGDDIVIGDEVLAEGYLKLIKSLGVEVSMAKTHVSPHIFEFAKRWIFKGQEITPFPVSALKHSKGEWSFLVSLLMGEELKGWSFKLSIPEMVAGYVGIFQSLPSKRKVKAAKFANTIHQIMQIIWSQIPAEDGINSIIRSESLDNPPVNNRSAMSVLRAAIEEMCFSSFDQPVPKGQKPLGTVAFNTYSRYWRLSRKHNLNLDHLMAQDPVLDVYWTLYQNKKDITLLVDKMFTVFTDWPIVLKHIGIPVSDSIFSSREIMVTSRAVSKVGDHVKQVLEDYTYQ
jgi:hypothetical protein